MQLLTCDNYIYFLNCILCRPFVKLPNLFKHLSLLNLPICTSVSYSQLDKKNRTFGSAYEQMKEDSRRVALGTVINPWMIKLRWWGYHNMSYSQPPKQWNKTLGKILCYKQKDNVWEHEEGIKQRMEKKLRPRCFVRIVDEHFIYLNKMTQ